MMELLAPAGGMEQLEYAIAFGADAVYLASDMFGMRQRASNFSLDSIGDAISHAHGKGVKVHVTLNTMLHEEDIDAFSTYVSRLEEAGADAFIIGDIGAARVAQRLAPDVDLHVSTQASVSNSEAAMAWHEMGAKRIVCAREMSIEDIASMRKRIPPDLEIEAFVHGAMCMAYSGRCLISDYLTGRSATSGHCTQSCRWNYTLEEQLRPGEHFPIEEDASGSYILNAQDLNMLMHLEDLEKAGVDSIKIEGRNKKAFYVATVVNAYRNVLDGKPAELFESELDMVSHRPYSTGFYYGPAHQASASDALIQSREWAAQVVSCEAAGNGTYRVEAICRNAFDAKTPLEALAPRSEPVDIKISDLILTEDGKHEPVSIANRAMERYSFECDEMLCPRTVIRMPK